MMNRLFLCITTSLFISSAVCFAYEPLGSIRVDGNISQKEFEILKSDYEAFLKFPFEDSKAVNLKKIIQLDAKENLSAKVIDEWLQKWVHFIVPNAKRMNMDWRVNPIIQYLDKEKQQPLEPSFELTSNEGDLGRNFGSVIFQESVKSSMRSYFVFKENNQFFRMEVTSPSIGIVQLGSDYFEEHVVDNKQKNITKLIDPLAFGLNRIATLLHEGAHSRGKGSSLGFLHVKCPGTEKLFLYGGTYSCDPFRNGGNGVKAGFLGAVIQACDFLKKNGPHTALPMCNSKESIAYLKEEYQDANSKVIGEDFWDETPSGVVEWDKVMSDIIE